MRRELELDLQKPQNVSTEQWVTDQLVKIQEGATEDAAIEAADAFSGIDHGGYTILETFNPATVTLSELGRAVATLIQYIQNRAPRKS